MKTNLIDKILFPSEKSLDNPNNWANKLDRKLESMLTRDSLEDDGGTSTVIGMGVGAIIGSALILGAYGCQTPQEQTKYQAPITQEATTIPNNYQFK